MPTLSARSLVLHHLHVAPASRSRVIPDVRLVGCGSRNLARLVHRDEKASDLQADMARHLIKVVPLPAGLRRQAKLKTGKLNSRRVGSTRSRLNPRSVSADPAAGSSGGSRWHVAEEGWG